MIASVHRRSREVARTETGATSAGGALGLLLAIILVLASARASAQETAPAAARPNELTYEHAAVVPFSFRYPQGWAIQQYAVANSSFHWLVASPDAKDLLRLEPSELPVALRVVAVGHEPALLGAEDALARAVEIARERMLHARAAGGVALADGATIDLGHAPARLARLVSADAEQRPLGLVLIAALGTTILVAEISWSSPELGAAWSDVGWRVLSSFRAAIDPHGELHRVFHARDAAAPEILARLEVPRSWTLTPQRAAGPGKALRLTSPRGFELAVRTAPDGAVGAGGEPPVDAAARLRPFLTGAGLATSDALATAQPIDMPGDDAGLRILAVESATEGELIAFTRGGGLHACVLRSGSALLGHDWGMAMRTLASLTGPLDPEPTDALALAAGGRTFARELELRTAQGSPFDADGRLVGFSTRILRLRPDGRFLELGREDGERRGTYEVEAGRITLRPQRGEAMVLEIDAATRRALELVPDAGSATAAARDPIFHVLPAIH